MLPVRSWMTRHPRVLVVLLAITVAGGALRGVAAANHHGSRSTDERAYARLTWSLVRHHDFGATIMKDPLRWGPGAPVAFAIALRLHLTPGGDLTDVPAAYPLQAAFATALIPAVFALGALLAGAVPGLVAAGLVAAYPPLISSAGTLLTEPLGALMLVLALIATVATVRRPGPWRAAVAGVLLALTVLVRVDLVAVPFLLCAVAAALAWRAAGRRAGLLSGAAMLLGVLVVLGPWTAHVSAVTGRFVPVSSGGASNLFVGTYLPGDGRMFGVKRALAPQVRRHFPYLRDTPAWKLPQQRVLDVVAARRPRLTREAALRAAAQENLRAYALGRPAAFTAMMARKAGRLWLGYSVGTFGIRRAPVTAYHLALVLLGLAGLLAAAMRTRGRGPAAALWPLVVVLAYVTAVNAVLVSEARHNLTVIPVLVVAGVAGAALAAGRSPHGRPGTPGRVPAWFAAGGRDADAARPLVRQS